MAQNMKLSIVSQNGDSALVEINREETFEEFQQKVFRDNNLLITVEDFQLFFEKLTPEDNLFNCLKEYLNIDGDNNLEDPPIYEINLIRNIKDENNSFDTNDVIENVSTEHFDIQNLNPSLIDLNQEHVAGITILEENIFETSNFCHSGKQITENNFDNHLEQNPNNETEILNSNSYNFMDIESQLAEIHSYKEEHLTDVCRLCAKNITGNKINIYNNKNIEKVDDKINSLFPGLIKKEDGLPQQVCVSCTKDLNNYYAFFQIVTDADKELRLKFLKENSTNSTVTELIPEIIEPSTINKPKNIKIEPDSDNEYEIEYLDSDINVKTGLETQSCRLCDLIIENMGDAVRHSAQEHHIKDLFACTFCELGFKVLISLDRHMKIEHYKLFSKQSKCKICLKKYKTESLLKRHTCQKNAVGAKTFHCENCNSSFTTKERLNFHRLSHVKNARPLFCFDCNILFNDEDTFFSHINSEHNTDKEISNKQEEKISSKPFQCHICGKSTSKLSRLRRHLLTHESNPIVSDIPVCDICKEAFTDEGTAEFHKMCLHSTKKDCIKIISTDKVFKCEYCEKCYYSPQGLNEHRSGHNGPTPFTCCICKAQFSSYSRCLTHKKSHGSYEDRLDDNFSAAKHFLCEYCGKSYQHWTYLGLHRRLKHSETVQGHKCSDCKLQFPNSWGLSYHRKTKHNEENYKCNECNQILMNSHSLKLHNLTKHSTANKNANQCVICGKIFQYSTLLENHMKCHKGLKEFKCILCPKIFLNIAALNIHFAEHKARKFVFPNEQVVTHADRPFSCNVCGLSFRRQFTLKNHKMKHAEISGDGAYVLMVDMKEDEENEEPINQLTPPSSQIQIMDSNNEPAGINYIDENVAPNYIDIGNGNIIQIQGNTFNMDGKQYILVNEKKPSRNHDFAMIVNETLKGEEMIQSIETNQQLDNNSVMYVDNNYMINQPQIPEFIFDRKAVPNGTTFVIDGNEFLLQSDEQTF